MTAVGNVPLATVRHRAYELLGLSGLAFTQPFLDLLSRNSEIVSSRSANAFELIVVILIVVIGPALAAMTIECIAGFVSSKLASVLHGLAVFALAGVIAAQVVKHTTEFSARTIVAVAAGAAAVVLVLATRFEPVRSMLRLLAFGQVLFVVLALAFSPLTDAVFASGSSAIGARIEHPHRVVMLVLDEFPVSSLLRSDGSGEIDRELFPNFAKFAAGAHWYRNSTTVSPLTTDSVPAMLSGKYPNRIQAPATSTNHPDNLFTALGATYSLHVHESMTQMCDLNNCEGDFNSSDSPSTMSRIGSVLRESTDLWWQFATPRRAVVEDITTRVERAKYKPLDTTRRFIAAINESSSPRLDFLHVLLPHSPWQYLADGSTTLATGRNPGWLKVWKSDWAGLSGYQRHLMQLQATDMAVGELVARLRAIDAYEDALVIITADHGVSFDTGEPNRGMSQKNAPDIAWAPLFIKYPNDNKGVVDDRPAHSIDIMPTIAEVLGLDVTWKFDGHSLLGKPRTDGPRRVYDFKLNTWHGTGDRKYVEVDPKRFSEVLAGNPNGATGDPLRLFRMVEHGDLIGTNVAALGTAAEAPITVQVDGLDRYRSITLGTGIVDWADIGGVVNGHDETEHIVVALNGTIAAVIPTTPDPAHPNGVRWWGRLLPDTAVNGTNELKIYVLRGTDTSPTLAAVTVK